MLINTKGAFSIARSKLEYTAFIELSNEAVSYFTKILHMLSVRWRAYRLLACGGSTVVLPKSKESDPIEVTLEIINSKNPNP